ANKRRTATSGGEVLGQELEEEVVTPGAVGVTLVLAQGAHLTEAERGEEGDGSGVLHRRVDDDPVVAEVVDEVAEEQRDGGTADALAVAGGVDEQVDASVAV